MTAYAITLVFVAVLWIGLWFLHVRPRWFRPLPSAPALPTDLRVALVIPARDEEQNLPALLRSLAGQGPADMTILVVNDHSTDATASRAREAARTDPRVRVLDCPDAPAGWAGKTWAQAQGAAACPGDWILFCDADTELQPDALDQAFAWIRRYELDCLSILPQTVCDSFSASSLLACFVMSRALLFSPAGPGRAGLVQGAFLAVRRQPFEALGGFDRVRASLLEDVEMGLLLQHAGARVLAVPATRLVRTNMRGSFADTAAGLRKHLFAALGYSFGRLAAAVLLHGTLFILPVGSLVAGVWIAANRPDAAGAWGLVTAAAAATAAMYAAVLRMLSLEKMPLSAALSVPFVFPVFAWVVAQSAHGYTRGGIPWKGRYYAAASRHAGERAIT